MALSWSMDSRRLMISTWFSRSHPSSSKTSVSDRPKRSNAATFTQSPGWRAAFRRFSPGRFQEAPLPTSSKTCSQSAKTRRRVSRLLVFGVAGYRHAGVAEQFSAHLSLAPGSGMAA